ncbi:MAG: hypothetical protein EOS78_06065 [Mesorhizobium sp.]|nr:MAG: hypothetical protein EOS78_06065 [Mesorhizobium sp.]
MRDRIIGADAGDHTVLNENSIWVRGTGRIYIEPLTEQGKFAGLVDPIVEEITERQQAIGERVDVERFACG